MFTNLKPKVILFDFYETLLDIWTDEADPAVWGQLARFLGYWGLTVDAGALKQSFERLVNLQIEQNQERYPEVNVYEALRVLLSDLGCVESEEFYKIFAKLFRSLSVRRFGLFEDATPVLQGLAGKYQLVLVTDAQRMFLEPEVQLTGVKPYFNMIVVSSDYSFHKPDPRMFTMPLEKLGCAPEEALYVGDSWERDIIGAQSVGIRGILLNRKDRIYNFEGNSQPYGMMRSLYGLYDYGLI